MNSELNTGIGGLILFNDDGSATYFAKLDGDDVCKLRGTASAEGVTCANGEDSLTITPAEGKGNLKGRGKAIIAGVEYPVVAFLNSEGSLGIKPNKPLAGRISCPW